MSDGGSQGGFITYLVPKNNFFSPIIWKSKSYVCRVVKSVKAAETLIQIKTAEACFWLAE